MKDKEYNKYAKLDVVECDTPEKLDIIKNLLRSSRERKEVEKPKYNPSVWENKNKQIEEMVKDKEAINEILKKVGIKYGMDIGGISYIVNAHKLAPYLQPKLPEDSVVQPTVQTYSTHDNDLVVLSREELHKRDESMYQAGVTEGKKVGGKEMAEKIFKELIRRTAYISFYDCRMGLNLDECARQCGVNIKE